MAKEHIFPFLAVLRDVSTLLGSVIGKPSTWYVTDLAAFEDKLMDAKEDLLDPIRAFMGGQQCGIYEEVTKYLAAQSSNFTLAGQAEADAMRAILSDRDCYKGTAIQGLKTRYHNLKTTLDLKIIEERKGAEAEIASCRAKLAALPEMQELSNEQRAKVLAKLDQAGQGLSEITLIAVLRDKANIVKSSLYPALLEEVVHLSRPPEPPKPRNGFEAPQTPPILPPQFVTSNDIKVPFALAYLSVEADVELYVDEYRKRLLAEIRLGKRIVL